MREYRIEFSTDQQQFHIANGTIEAETNGWQTVAENVSLKKALLFASYIEAMLRDDKIPFEDVSLYWSVWDDGFNAKYQI